MSTPNLSKMGAKSVEEEKNDAKHDTGGNAIGHRSLAFRRTG
jgi:hypothetical protein